MTLRRSSRAFALALLALAIALPATQARALELKPLKASAPATATHTQVTSPTLYCGPLLDKVCQVVCPKCRAGAPTNREAVSQKAAAKGAGVSMTCLPEDLQPVCSVLAQVICRKPCGATVPVQAAGAPTFTCAEGFEAVCYVIGTVFCRKTPCYANLSIRQLRSPFAVKE